MRVPSNPFRGSLVLSGGLQRTLSAGNTCVFNLKVYGWQQLWIHFTTMLKLYCWVYLLGRPSYTSHNESVYTMRYDTIRYTIFTCSQKLTNSQLNPQTGAKKVIHLRASGHFWPHRNCKVFRLKLSHRLHEKLTSLLKLLLLARMPILLNFLMELHHVCRHRRDVKQRTTVRLWNHSLQ